MRCSSFATTLIMTALPATIFAQPAEPAPQPEETKPVEVPATATPTPGATTLAPTAPATTPEPAKPGPTITVGGYFEEYYQLSAQNPSNRITNLRGFDNRSRTFTLSNVALDVTGEAGPITGHVVLQVGHTPSTYYLAEPASPGTGSVNASDSELWKYVQAANLDREGAARLRDRGRPVPVPGRHRGHSGQGQLELVALEPVLRAALLSHGRDGLAFARWRLDRQTPRLQRLELGRRQQRLPERRTVGRVLERQDQRTATLLRRHRTSRRCARGHAVAQPVRCVRADRAHR